jgi:aminopeptidase N
MLANVLNREHFYNGLHKYLVEHEYSNATPEMLWKALDAVNSKYNLSKGMSTWTDQSGFPLIRVEHVSARRIQLHQHRYVPHRKEKKAYMVDTDTHPMFQWTNNTNTI